MVDEVVQIFKTFDPIEIRNSCVALAGLKRAKRDGVGRVMTGDGVTSFSQDTIICRVITAT
jgi:hypothetical protein